ncbi:MAG TPA: CGNR zinc finger domain-containing protein [Stackebrandtia sp.]|uniref:CGNR zinc finger domain-containing protein n=1 Tax=Stackebrandtia sp. TaxID=2023065 RepID=UPI002D3A274C|nr:CGNR zinc finger domain-containing protein [Stackebrandtia sp.]HZE41795.1 CGNR zinc finger domain-containing protein [Stackebrandtia sp.]
MNKDTRLQLCYDAGNRWLNLLATVADAHGPDPVERLRDTTRLAEWLHHEMDTDADLPVTEADLAFARTVRDTLRSLATSAIDGEAPDSDAVAEADRVWHGYQAPQLFVADKRLSYTAPTSVSAAMACVVREAVTCLAGGGHEKLRRCAEPDCRAIFLDPTGRRRWCPSGRCGVKARVRAHRERAKAVRPVAKAR